MLLIYYFILAKGHAIQQGFCDRFFMIHVEDITVLDIGPFTDREYSMMDADSVSISLNINSIDLACIHGITHLHEAGRLRACGAFFGSLYQDPGLWAFDHI